jgi:prepilin-type N-terminal cleavage/methylation domain-containing protein
MFNARCSTFPKDRGFSLIELLVAMAITSILMVTLFSLVGQSTTSYTQTQRAVNAVSQARAFIQFFDRELSTRLPVTPLLYDSASPDRIAFIRTLTPDETDSADPGDLGTSIYYVDFSDDGTRGESPKLFRKNLGPADTQTLIEQGATPPFPTVNPTQDEAIIPNILSFGVIPKFRNPADGSLEEWADPVNDPPPALVELEITFIDDSSAQRFKTREEWNRLADNPSDSELQLIRTFTRTIAIAK